MMIGLQQLKEMEMKVLEAFLKKYLFYFSAIRDRHSLERRVEVVLRRDWSQRWRGLATEFKEPLDVPLALASSVNGELILMLEEEIKDEL